MGSVKRQTYNQQLMDSSNYNNLSTLRHLIANMGGLMQLEAKGDQVAGAIVVDLKMALKGAELTDKQKLAIYFNVSCGLNQYQTAELMGVSQRTVSNFVKGGLQRIRKYLTGGRPENG